MRAAGVAETVQVTGELPAPIATPVVGGNFKQRRDRTAGDAADDPGHRAALARGQRECRRTPVSWSINGAFAFDNVFMINGVDINDNLFATPQNLFIEDAIEETQVLTSGISAEYGRFTGGVINAITKSGGNIFSGSGRINFLNPTGRPRRRSRNARTRASSLHGADASISTSCRGPTKARSAARSCATGCGSSRQAATQSVEQLRRRCRRRASSLPTTDTNKRGEIKITGTVREQPHDSGRLPERPAQADEQLRPPVASSSIRAARSIGRIRTGMPTATTGAC